VRAPGDAYDVEKRDRYSVQLQLNALEIKILSGLEALSDSQMCKLK
jgi:hypothetical protein